MLVSIRSENFRPADGDELVEGEVIKRYFQGDWTQYVVTPTHDSHPELQIGLRGDDEQIDRDEWAAFTVAPDAPVGFEA